MTVNNNSDDFDDWAAAYDDDVADDGRYPFDGYGRVLQRIIDLAEVAPDKAVLELGVGTGNLTRLLTDRGADVWGVDFSSAMLAEAQRKVPTAHLTQANLLQRLPESYHRPFPVIVSSYVFHEFPTAEKIALLQRLVDSHLAPGGRIIIGDIGFPDAGARRTAEVEAGDRWYDEHYWLADETTQWAGANDLEISITQMSSCGVVIVVSPHA